MDVWAAAAPAPPANTAAATTAAVATALPNRPDKTFAQRMRDFLMTGPPPRFPYRTPVQTGRLQTVANVLKTRNPPVGDVLEHCHGVAKTGDAPTYATGRKRSLNPPLVLHDVIDRALQAHGSLGYSTDLTLEQMYRFARAARIYDDPYALAPAPKSLLTVFGAEHGLGGIAGYDLAETTDESRWDASSPWRSN